MKNIGSYLIAGIIAVVVVMLVLAGESALAQNKMGKGHMMGGGPMMMDSSHMAIMKDLRNDIKSYVTTNVLPDLTVWKGQLDKAMSPADLEKLNSLRSRATELRKEMRTKMQEMMSQMRQGDKMSKEDMKKAMQDRRDEMMNLSKEVKPLADKYGSTLKAIGDNAKPKAEVWKKDIMGIVDKWKEAHKSEMQNMKMGNDSKMHMRMMGRMLGFGEGKMNQQRIVTRFMLWDGSNDFLMDEMGMRNGGSVNHDGISSVEGQSNSKDIRSYPNPFSDKTTIYINNPKTQHVKVTVSDSRGNVIQTLYDGEMRAGDNSVVFDPSGDITSGTYFYKVTSGDMVKSGKMVYNK